MKLFSLCLLMGSIAWHSGVLAQSAFSSRDVKAVLNKVGTGLVYYNGRAVFKKARACALLQQEFATESIDRDVLVIGYEGAPVKHNDFGFEPQGRILNNKTFWEAGVFYDPPSSETRTRIEGGVRYETCLSPRSVPNAGCTAIEVTNDKVVMTSGYSRRNGGWESWKSTCEF